MGDRNKERYKNRKKDGKRREDTKDTKERQTDRLSPQFDEIVICIIIILRLINSKVSLWINPCQKNCQDSHA